MNIKGRVIKHGKTAGEAIITKDPISFFGGVDTETGTIVEKGHELEGKTITDKILVLPTGKGSTVGSYAIYEMSKNKKGPKAILLENAETIVATGAIISDIPCLDKVSIEDIEEGDLVEIESGDIKITKKRQSTNPSPED